MWRCHFLVVPAASLWCCALLVTRCSSVPLPHKEEETLVLGVRADGTLHLRPAAARANHTGPSNSKLIRRESVVQHLTHSGVSKVPTQSPAETHAGLGVKWLMLTSLGFLLVGLYAGWQRWWWAAALFSVQGVVCTAYHFCDAEGPWLLLGIPGGCPASLSRVLCQCDHGLAYLLFGQLALAILGPEDPALQSIRDLHAASSSCCPVDGKSMLVWLVPTGLRIPVDVFLLNRLGSLLAMILFLSMGAPWDHFHADCLLLTTILCALNFQSFWSLRHEHAADILLRRGFWRRVALCLLPPLLGSALLFLLMESSGNAQWLHGCWHLVTSLLAGLTIRRLLHEEPIGRDDDDDIHANPVVAHHIFWLAPCLAAIVMALYAASEGLLLWPALLHSEVLKLRLTCALGITAVFAGVAMSFVWQIVALIGGSRKDEQLSRTAAPLGCAAAALGILGVTATNEDHPLHAVRDTLLAAFCVLQTAAFTLVSMPAHTRAPGFSLAACCRTGVVWMLSVAELMLLVLHSWRRQRRSLSLGSPHLTEATHLTEAFIALLHLLWPLSWYCQAADELPVCIVRSRMQAHGCERLLKGALQT